MMLAESKLPHRFWAEVLSTCVYLRNHSPTKALRGITPWNGIKPDVSHFCVLECAAYVHVSKWREKSLILRGGNVCYWAMELTRRVTVFMTLSV